MKGTSRRSQGASSRGASPSLSPSAAPPSAAALQHLPPSRTYHHTTAAPWAEHLPHTLAGRGATMSRGQAPADQLSPLQNSRQIRDMQMAGNGARSAFAW